MRYRRAFLRGGSFFFTVVTEQRQPHFGSVDAVEGLRMALRRVRSTRPFEVDAMVVLPDHLHCIWTLPPGDADSATRWRLIKTWFTKHCDSGLRSEPNRARTAKREQALWQHRYWEHALRDEADFTRHVEYVHFNPVKHGLAASAMEWPYSTFRRYVEAEVHGSSPDWEGGAMDSKGIGMNDPIGFVGFRWANPT